MINLATSRMLVIAILCLLFPQGAKSGQRIVLTEDGTAYLSKENFSPWDQHTLLDEYSKLFRYDPKTNIPTLFILLPDYQKCNGVQNISIDPTGQKLAFDIYCELPDKLKKPNQGDFERISVIDIKTREIIINLDHGCRFAFSPLGDAIVFVNDYPGSSGGEGAPPPGYKPGIFIYNFNSKIKTEISSPVGTCSFNWSGHDGNIYFTDSTQHIFRYDVSKGQGSLVPYKGIYFSPDGKYNIWDFDSGDRDDVDAYPHIYRLSDQKKMTEWTNLILKKSGQWPPPKSSRPSMDFKFFCEKLESAVFSANEMNFIFDLSKGSIIGKFSGSIIGTNADGSLVLINPIKADNPQQIDHSQVKIINLLDLIKK